MPAIEYPHILHDGVLEVASGAQLMENMQTLKAAIEGLIAPPSTASLAGNVYTYGGSWASESEYTASATRHSYVTATFGANASGKEPPAMHYSCDFYADGHLVGTIAFTVPPVETARQQEYEIGFVLAAGKKWKPKVTIAPITATGHTWNWVEL